MRLSIDKILFVDDDPDIRSIVLFSLDSIGEFEVKSCESGAAALDVIDEFKPDLCLLDLMMPEMDGEELFACLRNHQTTRDTPVIFLTAQALEAGDRLLELGALGVIPKPFDPLELPDLIRGFFSD